MAEKKGRLGGRLIKFSAILAVLGVVVAAIVVKGFEQAEVKLNTQNLWILHKDKIQSDQAQSAYYGQVNTGLSELTSVNSVARDPGAILQSAFGASLLEAGNVTMADIDLADPADFAKDSRAFETLIDSTTAAISGNVIVFYGATKGSVSFTKIVDGQTPAAQGIGKPESLGNGVFAAATVSTGGVIHAFSPQTSKVYSFDTATTQWVGDGDDASGATEGSYQLSVIGDKWVLLDQAAGRVWVQGVGGSKTFEASTTAKLQTPSPEGSEAYFTTAEAIFSINLSAGDIKEEQRASGTNSAPTWFEGNVYASWLNSGDGQIFNSSNGELLDLNGFAGGKTLGDTVDPVIQTNGSAAILNDAQSGWAWNVTDGSVIPSTQDWQSKIIPPPPVVDGGEDAKKQEPPVANDDTFGARPDTLTTLPVILNDTDPNPEDVLTIDPKSVSGWDDTKGILRISADGQSFSLLAKETVKGSASFSYKVSDGSQANGTLSKAAATVTVSFAQGARNSAPVWCSDAPSPCVEREAPSASVLPGQSVSVEFADGFIDPEGDKVFISAASVTSGTGSAGFTAKGEVVFRSTLSKTGSETAKVAVTVSDTFGATTTKTLSVKVNPSTELSFNPFVVTTIVGQTKVVDILRGVTGSVGQVTLVQASKGNTNYPIVSPTAFSVTSSVAEQLQVAIKFTDENGVPKNSYVQVNVIEDKFAKIAVSPVTVLVRAGLDSTVDLYTAISNPSERSLIITLDTKIERADGAILSVGKVKGGNVRVRGETEDQAPGKVGTVRYTVSDGTSDPNYSAVGQIFVYQVPSASASPIAVDDSITLRAETTGDLDALANDVGTPGISLVLDAKEVTCKGTGFDEAGGLAFASHGVLRIVAPTEPGFYLCSYSIFSSDEPTLKSTANFGVNVTTKSSNKAPIAPTIRARVTSYATVEIPIPLSGIDPDGDTVSITSVGQSSAGKGFAAVSAKGNSVFYTVIPGQEGQDSFTYTVSDGEAEGVGLVKVGIFAKYSAGGPVTMVDVIDLVAGSDGKAEFDPTANDYDANGKGLTLVPGSVKPNLKEGTDAYRKSAELIAEPAKNSGSRNVTVTAAKEVTELEYVYSVKDGFGNVSLGSILVRVTKKAVPDQPQVLDTYVDAKERELLATSGVDVRTNKVTWLTGNPANLKLSIVGNARGFRVSGQNTLIGTAPRTATFVVFKLAGKNFANEEVFTYGILHIPAESKVINLRDVNKVWELAEGATDEEDLLDWISIPTGARVEIDGDNVETSGSGRPEGSCTFKSGTTVSYSAGNGGTKFNDVCIVPIRYVGEKSYTLLPLRIRVIANNPEPVFNNVTVEVMPGATSEVDLKSMVTWDEASPSFTWNVRKDSGSSITSQGPTDDLMTFSVVPGSEASEESKFSVRISGYETFGLITVIVGESPNAKPSATLTFDNKNCDFTSKTCSLSVGDLTGVVNAFPEPLKFMPFGYSKGTPNYKTGEILVCKDVKIKVVDNNTITATWKATTTQSCPSQIGSGALLDAEGKKGSLKVVVDLQGVPQAPLLVEQVAFTRTTVTLRIKAGDFSQTEFAVTEYVVREGDREVATCERQGFEAVTTCPAIEDLRPYHGNDKENLHTYKVTARNKVGESEAITGSGIYSYEKLKAITPDVIDAETVLGRETATDMGVLKVTLSPRPDPLAAKYIITGEGGTSAKTEVIAGDYKTRTFQLSAKPGNATVVTVRAEGAIPAPVKGSKDSSTTTWTGVVSGAPETGVASASIVGDNTFFGKVSLKNANRKYSKRTSKIAYVFWSGVKTPVCTFDEPTNTLTVESLAGTVVKYAEDRAFNDQVVDLVSSDIAGIQQNTSYRAKVCYSNGFKVAESVAPNTLSTISAPAADDFKYKVELASATQAKSPYLFTWVVKLAQSPNIPAGMKAQFSSTKGADKWMDAIYSEYWNERPVIKVRYCNTAGTICSGSTDVRSVSDDASWQVRIERAFLATADANATERPTCSPNRPLDLNFGVSGDGVAGWLGARPDEIDSGMFLAQYQLDGSTAWVDLDDSRSFYRARTGVGTIKKLRFWFKPNGGTTSGLEKVQVTIDVTC